MNYSSEEFGEIFKLNTLKKIKYHLLLIAVTFQWEKIFFIGNLNEYEIALSPDDFDGFGVNIKLKSRLKPYRPQDGIIKAEDDFFAWLAAVPDGDVEMELNINGAKN